MRTGSAGGRATPSAAADLLRRNVIALFSGLLLWTGVHFGLLAVLPLFLHDQGYDARGIGFALGAMGIAQLCVRPFGGWIVDAFGRRGPLVLSLVLLAGASALLLAPAGWTVLANRVLTGIAFSLGTTAFYTLSIEMPPPSASARCRDMSRWGSRPAWPPARCCWYRLYQGLVPAGAPPVVAIATVTIAASLASAACFRATASAFRPRGRAHPYSLRSNFRREGLLPALLNFCAQVPNTAFSAFLPLWAIGRGVVNPASCSSVRRSARSGVDSSPAVSPIASVVAPCSCPPCSAWPRRWPA